MRRTEATPKGVVLCLLALFVTPSALFATEMAFISVAAHDGYIKESGEHTSVGDPANMEPSSTGTSGLRAGDTEYGKQIKLVVSFDTSSIPDATTIQSATLRLRRGVQASANPFDAVGPGYADIKGGSGFNGSLTLEAADFEAEADAVQVATMSNPTFDGEWSQGRLNPTGRAAINKTGHTQFRVYHLPGDNDESTADYLGYYPGEDGAGYAPELIVTYDNPPAPPVVPEDPNDFHGVRTKWKKWVAGTGGATRATIIPGLRGLSVANWVKALEDAGANAATINLEARNNLRSSPTHPTYGMTEEQISKGEYTPDQRNTQLIDFLSAVQAAKDAGQIAGSIKFHVHQRLYPRHDTLKEQQFVDDFSDFIEKAKTYNVDHWLAGIRLGENGISETDLDYTLELSINWATAININTGDWLKTHGMEMSGGYMGAYFNNIDSKPNSATFFQEISRETGYFTFCFKHFIKGGIRKKMTSAGYDKNNVDDWLLFLRYDCGFADLVSFIDSYKASYPMHANCIFIGDSGDAMKAITDPEYAALTQMFTEAGAGFEGIIAVNGYLWNKDNSLGDCYKALHIVDPTGDPPVLLPLSYLRWSTWPDSPSLTPAEHWLYFGAK